MRKFIVLMLFLTSCSASAVQENSNSVVSPNPIATQNKDDSDPARKLYDSISGTWKIIYNDSQTRTAAVAAKGKTPNGEAQTVFRLACSANSNDVRGFDYIVRDSGKIAGFNFEDFEGPDGIGQDKKLVEIRAISPDGTINLRPFVNGGYGMGSYQGEAEAFTFEIGTTKDSVEIDKLARLVAKGSTEVIFIVHDNRDYQKTIETTFPGIDASSDVAKILKGCRK